MKAYMIVLLSIIILNKDFVCKGFGLQISDEQILKSLNQQFRKQHPDLVASLKLPESLRNQVSFFNKIPSTKAKSKPKKHRLRHRHTVLLNPKIYMFSSPLYHHHPLGIYFKQVNCVETAFLLYLST